MSIKHVLAGFKRLARGGVLLAVAGMLLLPVAAASAEPSTGDITGVVTGQGGAGAANVRVDAYASMADYGNGINNGGAAIAETGADGTYTMSDVPAGSYLIVFNQGGGGNIPDYATEFYPGQRSISMAQPVTVTAGTTTSDINAHLTAPGQISGKVTNTLGAGLANITMNVYASVYDYENGIISGGYHAGLDGTYVIGNLHEGEYIVVFNQPINMMYQSAYETQYYAFQPNLGSADPVVVTTGEATTGINAMLRALAPTNKDQCKNGGWQQFTDPMFKNQGQCIKYVEHHT